MSSLLYRDSCVEPLPSSSLSYSFPRSPSSLFSLYRFLPFSLPLFLSHTMPFFTMLNSPSRPSLLVYHTFSLCLFSFFSPLSTTFYFQSPLYFACCFPSTLYLPYSPPECRLSLEHDVPIGNVYAYTVHAFA